MIYNALIAAIFRLLPKCKGTKFFLHSEAKIENQAVTAVF
jgi:hypothetical protein